MCFVSIGLTFIHPVYIGNILCPYESEVKRKGVSTLYA